MRTLALVAGIVVIGLLDLAAMVVGLWLVARALVLLFGAVARAGRRG